MDETQQMCVKMCEAFKKKSLTHLKFEYWKLYCIMKNNVLKSIELSKNDADFFIEIISVSVKMECVCSSSQHFGFIVNHRSH